MIRSRLSFLIVAAVVVVAAMAALLAWRPGPAVRSGTGESTGVAAVGGPFKLVDQDGRLADESLLEGKWTAVFFGFTYCPDICPVTLQTLGQAQQLMGARGRELQTVFITVDPARDTPQQLKAYLTSPVFPRPTIGLTGSPEQVAAAAKAYRAPYSQEGGGDDYVMNHPAMLYLMDKRGRFNRIIPHGLTPQDTARQITTAMQQSP